MTGRIGIGIGWLSRQADPVGCGRAGRRAAGGSAGARSSSSRPCRSGRRRCCSWRPRRSRGLQPVAVPDAGLGRPVPGELAILPLWIAAGVGVALERVARPHCSSPRSRPRPTWPTCCGLRRRCRLGLAQPCPGPRTRAAFRLAWGWRSAVGLGVGAALLLAGSVGPLPSVSGRSGWLPSSRGAPARCAVDRNARRSRVLDRRLGAGHSLKPVGLTFRGWVTCEPARPAPRALGSRLPRSLSARTRIRSRRRAPSPRHRSPR